MFRHPRFGTLPRGAQLDRLKQSPHYQVGEFKYPIATPLFAQDVNLFSILWNNLFAQNERLIPDAALPVVKTEFKALDIRHDVLVWLGHSSWFVQLGGKRILIDPVFSDYAAPFSFLNQAFAGTSVFTVADLPHIDCLLISHDHWDHLDYATVSAIRGKVERVICPLGVGASLAEWGYTKDQIDEGDWSDRFVLGDGVRVQLLPARHYSGRLLAKNKTLWAGFALESPERRLFYSGDSGYGPHFSQIGQDIQGFDLVMLDCGQYDPRWPFIHMTPEEAARAARDLGAKALVPAHVGRFKIAAHPWTDPFDRLVEASRDSTYQLLTPKIGEPVLLGQPNEASTQWWRAR